MTMIRYDQPVHGRGLQGQQSSSGKTSGECAGGCNQLQVTDYEHHTFMKLAMDCKTYWLYQIKIKCLKGTDKLTDYMLSPSLALLADEWKKISLQNMRNFQGWYFSTCRKYWYDLYWRDQICEQGRESESELIHEKRTCISKWIYEPALVRRELWKRKWRKVKVNELMKKWKWINEV